MTLTDNGKPTIAAQQDASTWGQIVDSENELAAIEDEWRGLAEAQGNAFVTPDWYRTWLRHYGAKARPTVVAIRSGGDALLGVMPLVGTRQLGLGVLRFAGANLGDCFHPVTLPGQEAAVAGAAWAALSGNGEKPGAMLLEHSEDSGGWLERFGAADSAIVARRFRRAPLPYVRLSPQGWEGYLATRSRNFRSQVGRKRRRLERAHDLSFRRTRQPGELDRDINTLIDLHEERWGGLRSSASRQFHRDFAAAALERGWLRLWFLELDGEPVAGIYGWLLGGRYSYYLAGFSPRWARHSVGFVLLAHTVREAFEEGAQEYDLLLGGEAYKARFANASRDVETVALGPRANPAAIRLRADAALWRAGRRLSPSLQTRAASAYRRLSVIGKR